MSKKIFSHDHTDSLSFKPNIDKRKLTNLSIGILKLQFLFDIKNFSTKIFLIFFIAVFSGIGNFFLLERTGLYSLGINSLFQAIARCVVYFLEVNSISQYSHIIHPLLFWGLTIFFNIPLAVIGYKKIGYGFSILSIFFIFISSITSLLFFLFSKSIGFSEFYLFSDPRTFSKCLIDKKINILQWSSALMHTVAKASDTSVKVPVLNDSSKIVIMFCYGFVFGLLNTFTTLIVFAVGGSAGGVDWLVFYLSKNKNYSTNALLLYFGLILTFLSYTIGTYIPYVHHMTLHHSSCKQDYSEIIDNKETRNLISNFFSPVLCSTLIAVFTKKFCFNSLYPQFKLIKVKIFSNKVIELRNLLLSSDFPHSFTITNCSGGYLLRKQTTFDIVCFALELKTLMNYTRKIDPRCLIVATSIKTFNGNLKVQNYLN